MIQRIFYPVGQGAFYSERHMSNNINIVYDCGTEYKNRNNKGIKSVVHQSFSKDEVIDILFISHFDFDHISLIDELMSTVKEVKNVVIPLLPEEQVNLLSKLYGALQAPNLVELVTNPLGFFGNNTRVVFVESSSEELNKSEEPISLSDLESGSKRTSGTPLNINGIRDWVFIPYNYEFPERSKEFLDKLNKEAHKKMIDVEELKNDPKYIFKAKKTKELRGIYKSISGGINQNSMFLYSGPKSSAHHLHMSYWNGKCRHYDIHWYNYCFRQLHFKSHRVACLYTGDGDLNKVDVESICGGYREMVGTIQIPHHGSLPSFNEKVLTDEYFLCPISVGKNNSYGHPSAKVLGQILSHKSYPILVTEDVDSTFVEAIC